MDTVRQFADAAQGAGNRPKTIAALVDEMLHAIALDLVPTAPAAANPGQSNGVPKAINASPGLDAKWAISRTETPPPQNVPNSPYLSAIEDSKAATLRVPDSGDSRKIIPALAHWFTFSRPAIRAFNSALPLILRRDPFRFDRCSVVSRYPA